MAKKTDNLNKAKNAKNDEFYTMLDSIEQEVFNYTKHFFGKVVYMNCDDPQLMKEGKNANEKSSKFWVYFHKNFKTLGLKKIIATHFSANFKDSYKIEYDGLGSDSDVENYIKSSLSGNGDFRSEECIEILKSSDIVVTNPPFSLFVEFVELLDKFNKKFLIIGDINKSGDKSIFKLIKNNKLWLGITRPKLFEVPSNTTFDPKVMIKMENGKIFAKFGKINWYTNLDHKNRHQKLNLLSRYSGNEDKYPKYVNYDAINVNSVKGTKNTLGIPGDYFGEIGVPASFLLNWNPDQFEIITSEMNAGKTFDNDQRFFVKSLKSEKESKTNISNHNRGWIIVEKSEATYKAEWENELFLKPIYQRIIIKRK